MYYVVNLRERDYLYSEWFESDIQGNYSECLEAVQKDPMIREIFDFQIIEA